MPVLLISVLDNLFLPAWNLGRRFLLHSLFQILNNLWADPHDINRWLWCNLWYFIAHLVVHARFNISDQFQVLIKVNLRLVQSSSKLIVVFLLLHVWHWRQIGLPPGMILNLLPVYSVDRIFLKHFLKKIVELRAKSIHRRYVFYYNFLDKLFEGVGVKWRFTRGHFDHDASKRPEVRIIRVNPVVLEQLRRHIKRCASLILGIWIRVRRGSFLSWALESNLRQIGDFLSKTEVA